MSGHIRLTGNQVVALSRLVQSRAKGFKAPLADRNTLYLNIDDEGALSVSTSLEEEPYLNYIVWPNGEVSKL